MYRFIITAFVIFALHCNDVKISVVKLSEIVLIIYGILYFRRFHKISRLFWAFFTLWLILTFMHNLFMHFDRTVVVSLLQEPYICSVGRYLELFSCLSFIELVINYLKVVGYKAGLDQILKYNSKFCLFILLAYFFERFDFFSFGVITDTGRLCGFFNEGGPFGLLMAMLLILSFFNNRSLWEKAVLLLCLGLSISKAGAMLLLIYICIYYLRKSKYDLKIRRKILILLVPGFLVSSILAYQLMLQYSISWVDVDLAYQLTQDNPDDMNLVAGRVAGKYIVTNMIADNPIIGIGLGNYPILRNLSEYRSFFPKIDVYDAHGFGGIMTILCEYGLLGLIGFIWIIRYNSKKKNPYLVLLFVCVLLCGVQITFIYPWMLIGLNEFYYRVK